MFNSYKKDMEEVAYFMRRLYAQKLTTTSGGNISFKINETHVLITPSQTDKCRLQGDEIGIVTLDGENLTPQFKLSMETGMHLAIYRKRSDVKAVVHAHPSTATAFAVSPEKEIRTDLAGETWALTGKPAFAPYALMGTPELAEIVSEHTLNADTVVMEHHGILAVGSSLLSAFNKLELIESSARLTLITDIMGTQRKMLPEQLAAIDTLMGR